MKELNAWTATEMDSVVPIPSANAVPDRRLRRAEAEVRRLTRCVELKDRQLCELRRALAHSATVHYSFEDRLQRELDSLRIMAPNDGFEEHWGTPASDEPGEGVVVTGHRYRRTRAVSAILPIFGMNYMARGSRRARALTGGCWQ